MSQHSSYQSRKKKKKQHEQFNDDEMERSLAHSLASTSHNRLHQPRPTRPTNENISDNTRSKKNTRSRNYDNDQSNPQSPEMTPFSQFQSNLHKRSNQFNLHNDMFVAKQAQNQYLRRANSQPPVERVSPSPKPPGFDRISTQSQSMSIYAQIYKPFIFTHIRQMYYYHIIKYIIIYNK